jgi:hypothetical protein
MDATAVGEFDVFISYSRRDSEAARAFEYALRRYGPPAEIGLPGCRPLRRWIGIGRARNSQFARQFNSRRSLQTMQWRSGIWLTCKGHDA